MTVQENEKSGKNNKYRRKRKRMENSQSMSASSILSSRIFSSMLLLVTLAILSSIPTVRSQFSAIPPPATPTNFDQSFSPGPALPAPNRTQQPLPPLPERRLGSYTLNYDTTEQNVYKGINVQGNYLGVSIELSIALSLRE